MVKIFLTGVTGYIGGQAFADLYDKHPEFEYSLLVRSEEKGKPVVAKYPKVHLVIGDLDASDVIEKAAAEADIVFHSADSADHLGSARSIAKGIASGHTPDKPGYWIHVSGTGILTWYDIAHKRIGQPLHPGETYRDVADIDRILALPDQAIHRDVDKLVQAANAPAVRAAIVAPPTIYGHGRGPVNPRSQQVPAIARWALARGAAPYVGADTQWDNVHVHDLGRFFAALVEAALDPGKNDDPEVFGRQAYFFVESGVPHRWSEVAGWVAAEAAAQGYDVEPAARQVAFEEVATQGGTKSWAFNSSSVAERAKKHFGWKPEAPALKDTIHELIAYEAKKMGVQPSK